MVRTQNFLSPAARGSGTRGSVAQVSCTNEKNFLSPALRVSGTRVSGVVLVLRTQNFLSPTARGSG